MNISKQSLYKQLTIGLLLATIIIGTESIQAMIVNPDHFEHKKLSIKQFNALPFEEMTARIEEHLTTINQDLPYGLPYATIIRTLINGVKRGASSKEQFAVIMAKKDYTGENVLCRSYQRKDYLIAQFLLYRTGIIGDDFDKLLALGNKEEKSIIFYAVRAGTDFVDLILNHPLFKEPEHEAKLVKSILTPNKAGLTILHNVAINQSNLDGVKKLMRQLLKYVDCDIVRNFINAPVTKKEVSPWDPWNDLTAAEIALNQNYAAMAKYLANLDGIIQLKQNQLSKLDNLNELIVEDMQLNLLHKRNIDNLDKEVNQLTNPLLSALELGDQ